jgi:hypothetical protein
MEFLLRNVRRGIGKYHHTWEIIIQLTSPI